MRINEKFESDGSIQIEGFVKNIHHPIISISNNRGYWKVETSSCLPVEIDKAEQYLECMNKVMEKYREYRDCF